MQREDFPPSLDGYIPMDVHRIGIKGTPGLILLSNIEIGVQSKKYYSYEKRYNSHLVLVHGDELESVLRFLECIREK